MVYIFLYEGLFSLSRITSRTSMAKNHRQISIILDFNHHTFWYPFCLIYDESDSELKSVSMVYNNLDKNISLLL